MASEDRCAFAIRVIDNTEKGALQWTALFWLMRLTVHWKI